VNLRRVAAVALVALVAGELFLLLSGYHLLVDEARRVRGDVVSEALGVRSGYQLEELTCRHFTGRNVQTKTLTRRVGGPGWDECPFLYRPAP
jgi:hypothetical protein